MLAVCGQSKMATGSQLTFYVSIFTFSVILSASAAQAELLQCGKGRAKRGECEARWVQVGPGITHSSCQPKPFPHSATICPAHNEYDGFSRYQCGSMGSNFGN